MNAAIMLCAKAIPTAKSLKTHVVIGPMKRPRRETVVADFDKFPGGDFAEPSRLGKVRQLLSPGRQAGLGTEAR